MHGVQDLQRYLRPDASRLSIRGASRSAISFWPARVGVHRVREERVDVGPLDGQFREHAVDVDQLDMLGSSQLADGRHVGLERDVARGGYFGAMAGLGVISTTLMLRVLSVASICRRLSRYSATVKRDAVFPFVDPRIVEAEHDDDKIGLVSQHVALEAREALDRRMPADARIDHGDGPCRAC